MMSSTRTHWWSWVRAILNSFREMEKMMNDLDDTKQRETLAVHQAIAEAKKTAMGEQQIEIVRMVFFDKTHTLRGAAMATHVSYATAKRRQNAFIRLVGKKLGLS